jgi:chaperonin GroES
MEKKSDKLHNLEKKVRPLADRVLIKEIDLKKGGETKSGIIIPETVDKESGTHRGEVMAVGEGRYDEGKLIPMKVKVGDRVLFQWGDKITIDSIEYFIVSETNILAVIK